MGSLDSCGVAFVDGMQELYNCYSKLQLCKILTVEMPKNTHEHNNYLVGSLDSCGVAFVDGMQQLQLLQ